VSCTCAGIAPGYPQHEDHCGRVEHEVQVESDAVLLWRWECFACGKSGDGYTDLTQAERDADEHGATA